MGKRPIVKLLVDRGVIIEAMDSTGRTPLSYAAVNGHDAIVQLLVATSQVNVRRATIHEGELDFRENVIEPQSVGKLDTIDPHLVELDHHVQGSPLVPAGSDAGDATEMISEPGSRYASLEVEGIQPSMTVIKLLFSQSTRLFVQGCKTPTSTSFLNNSQMNFKNS